MINMLGETTILNSGFKKSSDIVLSQIRNKTELAKTINHELTHAYHHSIGLRQKFSSVEEYKKFSDFSAYHVGQRAIPAHLNIYGPYMLVVPPKLIPRR